MKAFTFGAGSHDTREDGMCLMEAVAYIAGEEHTDRPLCADASIASLGRHLNDLSLDEYRNRKLQGLPWRIVGTRTEDNEIVYKRLMLHQKAYDILTINDEEYNIYGVMTFADPVADDENLIALSKWAYTKICMVNKAEWEAKLDQVYDILDEMISLTEIKEVVPISVKEKV